MSNVDYQNKVLPTELAAGKMFAFVTTCYSLVALRCYYKIVSFRIVHPNILIMSSFTHPHVVAHL